MNILAVIPARAGSKGIPNKNIRIVAGRPLVYYSINNALNSQYITDVVVTTDSEEVRIIAEQMGAKVKWRNEALCKDDVTLDAVIADAVSDEKKWDYIITMQPTSPTLNVKTLDSAIEYSMNNDIDTLISAINAPHLSWGVKDGKKIPNYKERLNRQYLPPCYMETGAFVISKANVVTSMTRIGEKVDVYELLPEEAQDIDDFSDLQNVKLTMENKKVAIYVNGNNKRGLGHVYRALELADEFDVKPDIIFDRNQTDVSIFGETKHNLLAVDGIQELYEICKKKEYTIFINDILSTSIDYMIGLKKSIPDARIINFEDDGEGIYKADAVINALYSDSSVPNVYAGEKYYIPNKLFLFYKPINIAQNVKNIFISFGGADPQNYTDRLLDIITKKDYVSYKFTVVLGKAKKNIQELMKYNDYENIEVLYNVSNMPELMAASDIAVTSRGRTGYELAMLGIPSIAIAQNEIETKHGFISIENGFEYLGLNPTDDIIESSLKMYIGLSYESRKQIQDRLLSHKIRDGRKNVMKIING